MTLIEALGLGDARLVALVGAGGKTGLMFALAKAFADAGESVLVTTTTRLAADEVAASWPNVIASDPARVIAAAPTAGVVVAHAGIDAIAHKGVGLDPETVDRVAASEAFHRVLVEADGAARRPLKAPGAHEPAIPETADAVIAIAGLSGVGETLSDVTVFRVEAWSLLTGVAVGHVITPASVAAVAAHPLGLFKDAPATARRVLLLNQADTSDRIDAGRTIAHCLSGLGDIGLDRVVVARLLPAPSVADLVVLEPKTGIPR